MKIAITSHGKNFHGAVDFRFTQADFFVLYNQKNSSWDAIANKKKLESIYDAGTQAVETLKRTDAKVLITGHVGPKVFRMLRAEQIIVYSITELDNTSIITAEDALAAFLSGKLVPIIVPNALDFKKPISQKKPYKIDS